MQIVGARPPLERIGTLPLRQTKAVANIFAARAGVWGGASSGLGGMDREGGRGDGGRGGRGRGEGRGPVFFRPPFKNNFNVPVPIAFTGDGFAMRKR